jgi:hypothetical protein
VIENELQAAMTNPLLRGLIDPLRPSVHGLASSSLRLVAPSSCRPGSEYPAARISGYKYPAGCKKNTHCDPTKKDEWEDGDMAIFGGLLCAGGERSLSSPRNFNRPTLRLKHCYQCRLYLIFDHRPCSW